MPPSRADRHAPQQFILRAERNSIPHGSSWQDGIRPVNKQPSALLVNRRGTLGPHGTNKNEPALQFLAKPSRPRVVCGSQLADQAEIAEEWPDPRPPSIPAFKFLAASAPEFIFQAVYLRSKRSVVRIARAA